jgi:ABC-type multidrug transport system fused ATPase/permease subunit
VLRGGVAVEAGTHAALMQQEHGAYRDLVRLQMQQEK